jgi:hypothetical protein
MEVLLLCLDRYGSLFRDVQFEGCKAIIEYFIRYLGRSCIH